MPEGIKQFVTFIKDLQTEDMTSDDENFYQVAHWLDYYDDQSLEELVQALFNSTKPSSKDELISCTVENNTVNKLPLGYFENRTYSTITGVYTAYLSKL